MNKESKAIRAFFLEANEHMNVEAKTDYNVGWKAGYNDASQYLRKMLEVIRE